MAGRPRALPGDAFLARVSGGESDLPRPKRVRPRKPKPEPEAEYQAAPRTLGLGRYVVLAIEATVEVEEPLADHGARLARADAISAYAAWQGALDELARVSLEGEGGRAAAAADANEARARWDRLAWLAVRQVRVVPTRARLYLDPDGVVRARAPGPDGRDRVVLERSPTADELARAAGG